MLTNYRKLVAAVVGLGVLYANRRWGVDLFAAEAMIVDLVVSAGTAVAVWWFPNTPKVAA